MTASIFDTGRKGDLHIKFIYTAMPGRDEKEPTMQITHYGRKCAYLMPLPLAFQYIDGSGRTQVERATSIAERLYGFVTKDDVARIRDVIYEWVEDLVKMPPPPGMTRAEMDTALERNGVQLRINGQRVIG